MSPSPVSSPSSPTGATGPESLAGQTGQQLAPGGGDGDGQGGKDNGMKMAITDIRGMETKLIQLGKQFPTAAPSIRKASEAVRAVLRQIIANPGGPEPTAPDIGG